MPQRRSNKIDTKGVDAKTITTAATSRKRRTLVKTEEEAEAGKVMAKVQDASPPKNRNKQAKSTVNVDDESPNNETRSNFAAKIIKVIAKAAPEVAQSTKPRAQKRTATATEDPDLDESKGNKRSKKRKTKEEKDIDAMPLAVRTVVASLKHAMHIGAHVSAAGGEHSCQTCAVIVTNISWL